MGIIEEIINIATPTGYVGFIEFFVVVIMVLYVLYAFIMLRQVALMNESFKTPEALLFKTAATLHFLAALGIAFLGIIAI